MCYYQLQLVRSERILLTLQLHLQHVMNIFVLLSHGLTQYLVVSYKLICLKTYIIALRRNKDNRAMKILFISYDRR